MSTSPPASVELTPAPLSRTRFRPTWGGALLGFVLLWHAVLAVRLFPDLRSIVDPDSPVVMVDHAIHLYHGALGSSFLRDHGTTWGYDPFFMAGYPETPVWDSSSNAAIAFQWLAGGGLHPRAYKVGILLFSVLLPVLIAGGALLVGATAAEAGVTTLMVTVYFWAGFPGSIWRSGLFAFITAAAGVSLLLGLAVRFWQRPTWPVWLAMTASGTAIFALHVTAPIMAGVGLGSFYLAVARTRSRRWHAAVVGAVAVVVVLNLSWLINLWRFRGLRHGSGFFMTTDSPFYLLDLYLTPFPDNRLNLLTMIPGVAGVVRWLRRPESRPAGIAFGGSILGLMLIVGFGSLWEPTKVLEPLRFTIPLQFLLAVPAGAALLALGRWLGGRLGRVGAVAVGFVLLGAWVGVDRLNAQAIATNLITARPYVVGISPEARQLVAWIKEQTDPSARILLEDQLRLLEPTDPESVHWTPMLPSLLGPDHARMFIGGLYQTAFIQHHRMAAFGDFQLGDQPIDKWSSASFLNYCRLYNIGWVACWSPLSRFWFDRCPGVRRVGTLPRLATPGRPASPIESEWRAIALRAGPAVAERMLREGEGSYAVYVVDRPHSFFLQGQGRIVGVAPNRIELADIVPENGAAVVSLHWLDTWRADPAVTLKPADFPPDPVPLIRIESDRPIPRLVIENAYGASSP